MIKKEQIEILVRDDLGTLYNLLKNVRGNGEAFDLLSGLGKLPKQFDPNILLPFLENDKANVRLLAIKNLGKLQSDHLINAIVNIAVSDIDSTVRREAVSTIGRFRKKQYIPHLLQALKDNDPKVAMQAIRGLLVFKTDPLVDKSLRDLIDHPNEMIKEVISREFADTSIENEPQNVESKEYLRNVVIQGDVSQVLPFLPSECVHLTFTSPPYYNARDYAIYESYEAYLDFLTQVFAEVHRITVEGRFFVLNTSPVIVPRLSRSHSSKRYAIPFDIHSRLTQIGWEFIDDIVWMKPEASVKNRNGGFMQHRKPLGYKPNSVTEYVMVYRKKTEKLIDWNMRQYEQSIVDASKVNGSYETTNVLKIDPTFDKVHSAVFPTSLCEKVISYYSFVGDLVYDPFGGSGTVGKVANKLNRFFLMTEQNQEYIARMRETLPGSALFDRTSTKFFTFNEYKKDIQS